MKTQEPNKGKILISACLAGEEVRHDGGSVRLIHPVVQEWHSMGLLLPFCPEFQANMGVPRPPVEITGGDGLALIEGRAKAIDANGCDRNAALLLGAELGMERTKQNHVLFALLKDKSPSCGRTRIFDGTFRKNLKKGVGVWTSLLLQKGVRIFTEDEIDSAYLYWKSCQTLHSSK